MGEFIAVSAALAVGLLGGFILARLTGRRVSAQTAADTTETAPATAEFVESVSRFAGAVAPVWSDQIELCRVQMDTAMSDMTAEFAGIVDQLDRVLTTSAEVAGADQGQAFDRGRERLGDVVTTLDALLATKRQNLDDLGMLRDLSGELSDMANAVTGIAGQTKLLALNAAIEAARAGESGAAFRVVALEVRNLADRARGMSESIAAKVNTVGGAIDDVLTRARDNVAAEQAAEGEMREVLDDLHGVVSGLREIATRLEDAAVGVRTEVSQSLVSMQFQDRIGQVLSHVRDSISEVPQLVAESIGDSTQALKPLDPDVVLDRLAATYTMQDELDAHRSGVATEARESEITFF
jgi:methyl-accepting chemotaxis protein